MQKWTCRSGDLGPVLQLRIVQRTVAAGSEQQLPGSCPHYSMRAACGCQQLPTCCPSSRLDDRDSPEPVRDSSWSLPPTSWQAVEVVAAGVHWDGATSLPCALSSSARTELAEESGLMNCRQAWDGAGCQTVQAHSPCRTSHDPLSTPTHVVAAQRFSVRRA
jgi:hypothetical protein